MIALPLTDKPTIDCEEIAQELIGESTASARFRLHLVEFLKEAYGIAQSQLAPDIKCFVNAQANTYSYLGQSEINNICGAIQLAPGRTGKKDGKRATIEKTPDCANINLAKTELLYDSCAFSDVLTGDRISPEAALKRQLNTLAGLSNTPPNVWLVSYDRLVDEKHIMGERIKERWSVEQGEDAVIQTVEAAQYLNSQRQKLDGYKLVMSCQGVDADQYQRCVEQVLEVCQPDDVLGLGGWCILGKQKRWLPVFWEVCDRVIPTIAQSGIKQVHIFGCTWYRPMQGFPISPLSRLLEACDKHGLSLSVDGRSPISNALWKNWKQAGATFPYWRNNLAWVKAELATLRDSIPRTSTVRNTSTPFNWVTSVEEKLNRIQGQEEFTDAVLKFSNEAAAIGLSFSAEPTGDGVKIYVQPSTPCADPQAWNPANFGEGADPNEPPDPDDLAQKANWKVGDYISQPLSMGEVLEVRDDGILVKWVQTYKKSTRKNKKAANQIIETFYNWESLARHQLISQDKKEEIDRKFAVGSLVLTIQGEAICMGIVANNRQNYPLIDVLLYGKSGTVRLHASKLQPIPDTPLCWLEPPFLDCSLKRGDRVRIAHSVVTDPCLKKVGIVKGFITGGDHKELMAVVECGEHSTTVFVRWLVPVPSEIMQPSPTEIKESKLEISFGYTKNEILAGIKECTRRDWKDSHAAKFIKAYEQGLKIRAIDKDRRAGGKQIGWVTLTQRPYQQHIGAMTEADLKAEGGMCQTVNEFSDRYFSGDLEKVVWVIWFKFEPLAEIPTSTPIPTSCNGFSIGSRIIEDGNNPEWGEKHQLQSLIKRGEILSFLPIPGCSQDELHPFICYEDGSEGFAIWEQLKINEGVELKEIPARRDESKEALEEVMKALRGEPTSEIQPPSFAILPKPQPKEDAPIVDVWCGGGGVGTAGFLQAGFQIGTNIDLDPKNPKLSDAIADYYELNFGKPVIRETLQNYAGRGGFKTQVRPDVVIFTQSCKNLSRANQKGTENESDIVVAQAACQGIEELLPSVFVLENVREYKNSLCLELIEDCLEQHEYYWSHAVINAKNYGVPQDRERFILVAVRKYNDLVSLPRASESAPMGWYEACADLIDSFPITQPAPWQLKGIEGMSLDTDRLICGNSKSTNRTPTNPAFVVTSEQASNRMRIYLVERTGARKKIPQVRETDRSSWTIKSSIFTDGKGANRQDVINTLDGNGEWRRVTNRGVARLMGLYDWYQLPDAPSVFGPLLGNGLPSEMARAIGEHIKQYLPEIKPMVQSAERTQPTEAQSLEEQIFALLPEDGTGWKSPAAISHELDVSPESVIDALHELRKQGRVWNNKRKFWSKQPTKNNEKKPEEISWEAYGYTWKFSDFGNEAIIQCKELFWELDPIYFYVKDPEGKGEDYQISFNGSPQEWLDEWMHKFADRWKNILFSNGQSVSTIETQFCVGDRCSALSPIPFGFLPQHRVEAGDMGTVVKVETCHGTSLLTIIWDVGETTYKVDPALVAWHAPSEWKEGDRFWAIEPKKQGTVEEDLGEGVYRVLMDGAAEPILTDREKIYPLNLRRIEGYLEKRTNAEGEDSPPQVEYPRVEKLNPDDIILDQGTQSRLKENEEQIHYYKEAMECGDWDFDRRPLPEVLLGPDGKLYPIDCHHRVKAMILSLHAGRVVPFLVHKGTLAQARIWSTTANTKNGLGADESPQGVRKRIEMFLDNIAELSDKEYAQEFSKVPDLTPREKTQGKFSSRTIARYLRLRSGQDRTVSNIMKERELAAKISQFFIGDRVEVFFAPEIEEDKRPKGFTEGEAGTIHDKDTKLGLWVKWDKLGNAEPFPINPDFVKPSTQPKPKPIPTAARATTPTSITGNTESGGSVTFTPKAQESRVLPDTERNEDETAQEERTPSPVPSPMAFQTGAKVMVANSALVFHGRQGTITSYPNNNDALVELEATDSEPASKERIARRDLTLVAVDVQKPLYSVQDKQVDLVAAVRTVVDNLHRLTPEELAALEDAIAQAKRSWSEAA